MPRFLHSNVLPETDVAASASITPFDLPVNPLSFLLLRLQTTNTNPNAIAVFDAIDEFVGQITNITIKHKGENIISGSLRDLMLVNAFCMGAFPWIVNGYKTNAAIRSVVFPLCLGRRPYDPKSCFPATTRGNLRFELTAGADPSSLSDVNMELDAVELIDTTPEEYLKYTTLARDSVAGQFDFPLPIGNDLLGMLLFDTGIGASTDEVSSWGSVKLLKDNVEQYFPASTFQMLAGLAGLQLRDPWALHAGHRHQINDGAALSDSDQAEQIVSTGAIGYAYLDFDPLKDGSYAFETKGASDVKFRSTGDEATSVRVLPIERVMVGK